MTRTALFSLLLTSIALAAEELPLSANEYSLTITHRADHPKVSFPGIQIAEKEYQAVQEHKILQIRFSDDRKSVEIMPGGFGAQLVSSEAGKRVYQLDKGSFGGGLFIIESTEKGLTATLTLFGSGVPVISSSRGELKPKNPEVEQGGAKGAVDRPALKSESGAKP